MKNASCTYIPLLLMFLYIFSLPVFLNGEQEAIQPVPSFRGANWGMSQDEVIKIEGTQPTQKVKDKEGYDVLLYSGSAGSLEVVFGFMFAENKLVKGRYIFMEKHVNKNLYIQDFQNVETSLSEKYGKQKTEQKIWKNNLYRDDANEWGTAISAGHLVYRSTWDTEDTEIIHHLSGDNFEIWHQVLYTSSIKEHVELMKKVEDAAKKRIW